MKLTKIRATYGGKLNLGNFQSAEITMTLEAELEAGEDRKAAYKQLFAMAREAVIEEARPLIQKRNAMIDGVFTNLPSEFRDELRTKE